MNESKPVFLFGGRDRVPTEVAGLFLNYVEVRDEHDRVTICRYDADTPGGHWLGANTFLYDRGRQLDEGATSKDVIEERDRSLRALNGGAVYPEVLGVRQLSLPAASGGSLHWQWASLRDGQQNDALITHVAIRVDRALFNKVLFSYPAVADELGRKALIAFLTEWHRSVLAA